MFGKKLLSLISLLFAGSQLISVARADDCKYNNGATELISGDKCDGSSYLVAASGAKVENAAGVAACLEAGEAQCTLVNCPLDAEGDDACSKESNYSGFVVFDNTLAECTSGVCIYHAIFASGTTQYLVRDLDGSLSKKGKAVAVTSDGSDLTLDSTVDDDDFCVRKGIITPKLTSYCKGDCAYYRFDGGISSDVTINARAGEEETPNQEKCNPAVEKPDDVASVVNRTPSAFHCDVGYYITNEESLFEADVDGDGKTLGPQEGTLYYCSAKSTCSSITKGEAAIGYYKNANAAVDKVKYIQCSKTKCEAVFTDPTNSSCDSAANGELIKEMKICNTDAEGNMAAIDLTGATSTKYFVQAITSSGTIFDGVAISGSDDETKYSIIVEIDANKAVVAAKAGKKYRYTDASYQIYDVATDALCATSDTIKEFVLSKEPAGEEEDKYDYYSTNNVSKEYTNPDDI